MIEKTLVEVTNLDIYTGDRIYIESLEMYADVIGDDELGMLALIDIPEDSIILLAALRNSGKKLAYSINDHTVYYKVIEEEV